MSFTVRCPFCHAEMECPDDVLGQVGQCVSCGREIDLEPVGGSPVPVPAEDPNAQAVDVRNTFINRTVYIKSLRKKISVCRTEG